MIGSVEKRRKYIAHEVESRYLYGALESGQLSMLRWIERSALDGKNRGAAATGKHRATERAIHLKP
jgi:hypothetical protein